MHLHIIGVCGTFMGGVAQLARALGHTVSGQDANVYPPMSTQLINAGIDLTEGYAPEGIPNHADVIVIGNAMSRGNPAVEYVLNRGLRYTSGPQWLAEQVLHGRWVVGVAGTHGKTTTTSMVARILDFAGLEPGFLVGGVPQDFGCSARLGTTDFFIVEADEYDTAFFDKRSKFVHYRPRTTILNNLEFDHADIFPDLSAIQRQFHHLVRTVPGNGLLIAPQAEINLDEVLRMGCWTPVEYTGSADGWSARDMAPDGGEFDVYWRDQRQGRVTWSQFGMHNVNNALAAIAAARHAGVPAEAAVEALAGFQGVKRRMETRGTINGVTVYDDFAHHPTAVASTVGGLRRRIGSARLFAVLEPRSNTMRMGVHRDSLAASLRDADRVYLFQPTGLNWDLAPVVDGLGSRGVLHETIEGLVAALARDAHTGDHILVMSNGDFGGIHQKLLDALRTARAGH